ncbi:MAG: type II toxin-antitoxin system Phd/YefM family antitoxin [Desulfatiglandaceae bacterium]
MKRVWQLQEAKNRLSAVVEEALQHGPQIITRRGRETVVVLSVKEYKKMTQSEGNLVDFFSSSPLYGVDIDLKRNKELPREIEF